MYEHAVHTTKEMHARASEFVDALTLGKTARVVALRGDLGSGKTTFAQGVARALGVRETVTSPTFVLLKNYALHKNKAFHTLIHIDAYRLKDARELEVLGWDEMLKDPGNLILIEWPEQVPGIFPQDTLRINFSFVDENTRRVTME